MFQKSWEHGSAIARAIRSVHLPHALTGPIRFGDDGKRVQFSLDVMEMTPESSLVKVGTWSDEHGLQVYFFKKKILENNIFAKKPLIIPPSFL